MCTPLPPAGPQTHAEAPLLLRLWTARVPCRGHVLHPGELDLGGGGTKSPGRELSRGLGLAGVGAPGVGEGSQETRQKAPSSPPPSVRRPRAISGRQLPGPPQASQCCGLVPTR